MKAFALLLSFLIAFGASAKPPSKSSKRAASGGKGAKGSAKSSGGKSSGAKSSGGGGSKGAKGGGGGGMGSKTKGGKKGKNSDPVKLSDPNDPAPCLRSGINRLIGVGSAPSDGDEEGSSAGACKFLLPPDMRSAFKPKDFLCIYNVSSSAKAESVWDYYLIQNYGIKENGVKEGTSVVDLKYKKKGLYKYYEYLITEMNNGSLKENKIFTTIADEILDRNEVPLDASNAIENKSVESVMISLDITKSDMTSCAEAIKAISTECGEMSDPEAKKAVENSCIAYDAALTRRAGEKRIEAMSRESDLLETLMQRVGSGTNIDAIILNAREKETNNKEKAASLSKRESALKPEPESEPEIEMPTRPAPAADPEPDSEPEPETSAEAPPEDAPAE